MQLFFDSRWIGEHGIGRFAREIRARLPNVLDIPARGSPASAWDAAYLSIYLSQLPKGSLFYSPGYNAPLIAKVPFVFSIHDLCHLEYPTSHARLKAVYYDWVMKPACRRALRIVTVSEYSRQKISEWSGVRLQNIVNVGNGVGDAFRPQGDKLQNSAPYVMCAGNRKPHKNEQRSLEAFAMASSSIPHNIILTGSPTQDLVAWAAHLKIGKRVSFLGRVTDTALANAYRGAAALLFASLHEGFGLPVIEAMACGTPVITSNICSLPEVSGGAAVLVDPKAKDDIAAALLKVLSDSALAEAMRVKGLQNSSRYTWQETASKLRLVLYDAANT